MRDDIVVLRSYAFEHEARFAAEVLAGNDIPAEVVADTAGGYAQFLAIGSPYRLLVRAADADAARDLLADDAAPADGGEVPA